MSSAEILAKVQSLLESGQIAEAAKALSGAAQSGDGGALYELALWSVAGNIIPRDLQLAYQLLTEAKDTGHDEAALLYAYFTASGTGCNPRWETALGLIEDLGRDSPVAQRQCKLLEQMQLNAFGDPATSPNLVVASDQPKIAICHQLLTAAECDYVIDHGQRYLVPSDVVDPQSGKLIPHPVRRSQGAMFGVFTEDMVINAINRRIAHVSGTRYEQGEPLQLLKYVTGDEYRPHIDALPHEPNQRTITVIVYLSENYAGGETQFLRTGFSFKGQKGDALLFANTLPDDRPDPLSLHCGTPVNGGSKFIATRWIRRNRFTYPSPQPLLARIPAAFP